MSLLGLREGPGQRPVPGIMQAHPPKAPILRLQKSCLGVPQVPSPACTFHQDSQSPGAPRSTPGVVRGAGARERGRSWAPGSSAGKRGVRSFLSRSRGYVTGQQ